MSARQHPRQNGIPDVMTAAAVDRFGPPSLLKLHQLPVPKPGRGEVLIALDTAGVGVWDASIREGSWRKPGRARFPLVPGTDGSGVVAAKGPGVRRFRVGDRVYAYEFGNRQGGFYAEYTVANADHVAAVPRALGLREAGAAATTGLTALQGIDALRLKAGDTVLIFGASGAVGTLAVEFAAQRGARVLATASGKAAARLVQSLGATAVVDARSSTAVDELRSLVREGLDAVLALAGGKELERCLDLVKPGGHVAHPNGIDPVPPPRRTFRIRSYDAIASPRQFARLSRRLARRAPRVPIAATYPLARAAQAHRRLQKGHVLGRIVLSIRRQGH